MMTAGLTPAPDVILRWDIVRPPCVLVAKGRCVQIAERAPARVLISEEMTAEVLGAGGITRS